MEIGITDCNSPLPSCRMFEVTFYGHIIHAIVTARSDTVDEWIDNVVSRHRDNNPPGQVLVVGLCLEWCSEPNPKRVAVLQLCVDDLCLVYQISHCHSADDVIPRRLADFLSPNNSVTFVGSVMDKRMRCLEDDYGIGEGAAYVDLQEAAALKYRRFGLKFVSLGELAMLVLGKGVLQPIPVMMTPWEGRELTNDQVLHACVDAYMSFAIGKAMGIAEAAEH